MKLACIFWGAMTTSSSMRNGNLARLRLDMVNADSSCRGSRIVRLEMPPSGTVRKLLKPAWLEFPSLTCCNPWKFLY